MMKKNFLIYSEDFDQFCFFIRFRKGLKDLNYNAVMVTQKPAIYLLSMCYGIKSYLIKVSKDDQEILFPEYFEEMYKGILNKNEISKYFTSAYRLFEKLFKKITFEYVFIFNGNKLGSYCLSKIAKQYKINRVFFEVGNLPEKMFIDPNGVNASSYLYENPNILDSFVNDKDNFLEWKKNYLNPRSKQNNKFFQLKNFSGIFYFIDILLFRIFTVPISDEFNLGKKIDNIYLRKKKVFDFDRVDLTKVEYIFFPLQVKNDTQLLLNSDISIIAAIEYVSKIAIRAEKKFVIKPHPKEINYKFKKLINSLKEKYGFMLVNNPIKEVILNAKKVYTINSTVGLEAMILGKEVEFLGRSFYPKLKSNYLEKFITQYLVDIEYNSSEDIPSNIITEILARTKL